MHVTPGLFDKCSLIREWERVGSPGTVRKDWFDTEEDAVTAGQKIIGSKQKKGYLITHNSQLSSSFLHAFSRNLVA